MSLKTQVQELLNKLNTTEAKQNAQWQEAYDLALNAKIQADRIIASYGADDKAKTEVKIKQMGNYKLPHDIAKAYGGDANNFADGISEYIPFNAINEEDIEEIELFKRYAFLGGSAVGIKKEKKTAYFGGYTKSGKIRVSKSTISFENIKDLEKNKMEYQELKQEECVVLKLWWDSVGFGVKAIPFLGTYIYYKRSGQKTMSFAQIMPVIGVSSDLQKDQISHFLTDPDTFEWNPPKDATNMLSQGDFIGEKMKGLIPEGIEEIFKAQILTVDKHGELLCNYFGRVVENAAGEQRLAADANTFSSNSEFIMKGFIKRIKAIAKEMSDVAILEEDKVEEQMGETKGEANGNDNAQKNSSKSDNDDKGILTEGRSII